MGISRRNAQYEWQTLRTSVDAHRREWTLVIPVKQAVLAKSRLVVSGLDKAALARAFALDTIEAAVASDRVAHVVVVTSDLQTATALESIARVTVMNDTAGELRGAIELGLAAVGNAMPRGVLLGDLPALQPFQLSDALARATTADRAFVPDADGTGTSLATAWSGVSLPYFFGPHSAAAHRAARFAEITLPSSSGLRRDVDTAEHLAKAHRLGLGRHTVALVR
jgi:2-phospho-L-lactate guanylyltransferase